MTGTKPTSQDTGPQVRRMRGNVPLRCGSRLFLPIDLRSASGLVALPGKVDLCIQHDPGNRPATSKQSAIRTLALRNRGHIALRPLATVAGALPPFCSAARRSGPSLLPCRDGMICRRQRAGAWQPCQAGEAPGKVGAAPRWGTGRYRDGAATDNTARPPWCLPGGRWFRGSQCRAERARKASARLATSTARPAATAPARLVGTNPGDLLTYWKQFQWTVTGS
jgi:hypothetical protein